MLEEKSGQKEKKKAKQAREKKGGERGKGKGTIIIEGIMASLPVIPGHEGFIRKSHLLAQRPRGQSQPMPHAEPESAIERDQRIGLVRNITSCTCLILF